MKTLRRHPPLTSSSPTLLAPMHGPATIVSNTNLLQASWAFLFLLLPEVYNLGFLYKCQKSPRSLVNIPLHTSIAPHQLRKKKAC